MVPATSYNTQINSLLEKMESTDRDIRYMAINDLINILEKPKAQNQSSVSPDDILLGKMIDKCIRSIKDKIGEIQSHSIKFLVVLINQIKNQELFNKIFLPLTKDINTCGEGIRDAVVTALKSSVKEAVKQPITQDMKILPMLKAMLPILRSYIECEKFSQSYNFKVDILDIMIHIIKKIDACAEINSLLSLFFNLLENGKISMRKLAIVAISSSCESISSQTFDDVMNRLMSLLQTTSQPDALRIYVSAVISICKQNPKLLVPKVDMFMETFLRLVDEYDDDELKEAIITGFDVFISRCSRPMTRYIDEISQLCIKYIKHDPNYHDNVDEDTMETEDDGESSNESEDSYSDDEDYSWKVRKASTKCITTICTSKKDDVSGNISKFLAILISRIKEREENVRIEIIRGITNMFNNIRLSLSSELILFVQSETTKHKIYYNIDYEKMDSNEIDLLKKTYDRLDSLISGITKLLKTKHSKTKQTCFVLLKTLLLALPGCLSEYLKELVSNSIPLLLDKHLDIALKLEILNFIATSLQYSNIDSLPEVFEILIPVLGELISTNYFKIISEVISVSHNVIEALNIMKQIGHRYSEAPQFMDNVNKMDDYVFQMLKIGSKDQDVREKIIRTSGILVATLGDLIETKTMEILQIYVDNLSNESSRNVVLQSLTVIVKSSIKINLLPFLPKTLVYTGDFLKRNDRNLKIATLNFLVPLTGRFKSNGMQGQGLINTVKQIPQLITNNDFLISRLAFKFMTEVISYYPDQISEGLENLVRAFVEKTKSNLMQGQTVTAALEMISNIVKAPLANKPSNEELLSAVSLAVYNEVLNKQSLHTISKTVATILKANGSIDYAVTVVNSLSKHLSNPNCEIQIQQFVILTYGEVGRLFPEVFESPKINESPEVILLGALENSNEDIKSSASISIGHYVIGNITKNLPFLFSSLETNKNKQYLLLHALKEVITSKEMNDEALKVFQSKIPLIWNVLVDHAKCGEEGTRNVVAECMGRLAIIIPSKLIPQLTVLSNTDIPEMITTSMTAVRYILSFKHIDMDKYLIPVMEDILNKFQSNDTNVKRHAILTFNAAVNNRSKIVRPFLSTLLSLLYAETDVNESFIEIIEMGPFKHKIDKRIEIRKATFECMYALATNCIDSINVFEFLSHFEKGLTDEYEIKMLAYLMITRFINLCPSELHQRIEFFSPKIRSELQSKIKENASDAEKLKDEEIKKCAVRAVYSLRSLPGYENSKAIDDIKKYILEEQYLAGIYDTVTRETGSCVYISESTMETD
uniref:TIP120 domain-containing protein n=1 Tax=Parastrongyloides trichosuri TaxID=131310 RepID=A0A0N4Z951_PARTI